MNLKARVGQYLTISTAGEAYRAYVPQPLPPNPALKLENFYALLDRANTALGRLDGISNILPDPELFLYLYIRKEAVLSSQIEGTQSSLSDLLMYENQEMPGVPEQDVVEVSRYVAALEYGLKRLKQEQFPLSLRLIREIHEVLMTGARGSDKNPGEFRCSQNWIGGTRPGNAKFVPPPPEKLMDLLGQFEGFLHEEKSPLPKLVKAALAHVQFEIIHPFLDGNGRLGRLLITFLLCHDGLLNSPLLYLSLYLKTHRQHYYDLLQLVRETGDWESWLEFFLEGVVVTANQAVQTAQKIMQRFAQDREKIEALGRPAASALRVYHHFQKSPRNDIAKIAKHCHISIPTVGKSLQHLVDVQILREITGKGRQRIFVYQQYLDILEEGIGGF